MQQKICTEISPGLSVPPTKLPFLTIFLSALHPLHSSERKFLLQMKILNTKYTLPTESQKPDQGL